jgi:hypothetical protein
VARSYVGETGVAASVRAGSGSVRSSSVSPARTPTRRSPRWRPTSSC